MRVLLVALLAVSACAARPNRTGPEWQVTPAQRAAIALKMGTPSVVVNGPDCEEPEEARAELFAGVVERELYDAGFDFVPEDGDFDVLVGIAVDDCRDALRGDVKLTVLRGASPVTVVERNEAVLSNLRVPANLLVDDLLRVDALTKTSTGA